MSDSGSDREWMFVDNRDDENHSSDSGSSTDFVHVDGKRTVFYRHKSDGHSVTSEDHDQSSASSHCSANDPIRPEATEQCPSGGDRSSDVLMSGSESHQPEADEADSEGSAPELLDSLENSLRDDLENSEPELLDERVVSALTCPGSAETIPLNDGAQDQLAPADNELTQTPSDGVNVSESSDSHSGDTLSWEENQWFWDEEVVSPDMQPFEELGTATDHASSQNDSASDGHEEAESASQSSSGIEELAMPEEEEEAERMAQSVNDGQDIVHVTLPSVEVLKREEKASKTSDTESDFSDIVRIEQNPKDASTSHQEHRHYFRAVDLMQVSASSTSSSGNSSLSSRFHFVHPLPRRHRYIYPRDEEEDTQSLPGDVDDRCESDISGVVPDDSDPDLSSISYSLDQLEIMEGDVIRSYKHRPNSTLNTFLSILALLTLFTTIGVGIGHYLGTSREVMLRSQQTVRFKEIQDEYLRCLHNQELLEAQVSITDTEKIAAVTAVWKQKYEELIIEKVELEQTMKQLEKNMEDDLREAKNKLLANRNEAELLGNDINNLHLHHQYDQVKSTASSEHGTKQSMPKPGIERMEAYLAEKEAHLFRQRSELEERELQLEEREAELNEKSVLLNKQQADLMIREASLASDKNTLIQRNERLDVGESNLKRKELLLIEREVLLREEHDQLEKDKGNMRREENELHSRQVKLQEGQELLQEEQTRLQIEWAKLQKEQATMEEEQVSLVKEQAKLEERQNKLQKEQMESEKEQDEQLEYFNRFKELQEQTNLLRIENDELRQQVARLRYTAYNQRDKKLELNEKELKETANRLANENTDLKTAVAKLRYTKPLSVDNKGTDNSASGSVEVKSDAENVQQSGSPLSDEATNKKPSGELKQDEDWFPVIWSYLNMVIPAIDLSDLQKLMFSSKITKPLSVHLQFIKNITSNEKFANAVKEKLSELKRILGNSFKTDQINNDVNVIIADLKAIFQKEIESFQHYIQWEELQAKKQSADRSEKVFVDQTISTEPARKYHEFVNKTKQGVLHLNEKIKHAWSKVKNVTGDFLKKNKVLKEFGDSVTKSVKQVKRTMEAKWKKVKKHLFKKGLMANAWAWSGHQKAKHGNMHRNKHSCPQKQGHGCKKADTIQSSYEAHYHDHMGHETLETKQFKKEPGHQNKQSSTTDYEKYEEYWQQAEFEPDDFLQEGFFEGNNRKWSKHQNKARKLHGRLQRLTDDIFLAMDDDDVEDMYEDFEDLQEDMDSQDQPKELMTWLTCQVRWWKSRLYRKHSNEDLVKGCGRQLMQWQLRALCKPCDIAQRRCRKRQRGATEGPFCRYYQSVILPSLKQGLQGADDGKAGCDRVHSSRKVLTFVVDSDTPHIEGQLETENGRLKYSMKLDGDVAPEPTTVGNNTDEALAEEPSAKWLFERAEDRESYHHNGLWMFKRGALRDFERNKPWYYERAEHRADKRFSRSVRRPQNRNSGNRYDRSGKN